MNSFYVFQIHFCVFEYMFVYSNTLLCVQIHLYVLPLKLNIIFTQVAHRPAEHHAAVATQLPLPPSPLLLPPSPLRLPRLSSGECCHDLCFHPFLMEISHDALAAATVCAAAGVPIATVITAAATAATATAAAATNAISAAIAAGY